MKLQWCPSDQNLVAIGGQNLNVYKIVAGDLSKRNQIYSSSFPNHHTPFNLEPILHCPVVQNIRDLHWNPVQKSLIASVCDFIPGSWDSNNPRNTFIPSPTSPGTKSIVITDLSGSYLPISSGDIYSSTTAKSSGSQASVPQVTRLKSPFTVLPTSVRFHSSDQHVLACGYVLSHSTTESMPSNVRPSDPCAPLIIWDLEMAKSSFRLPTPQRIINWKPHKSSATQPIFPLIEQHSVFAPQTPLEPDVISSLSYFHPKQQSFLYTWSSPQWISMVSSISQQQNFNQYAPKSFKNLPFNNSLFGVTCCEWIPQYSNNLVCGTSSGQMILVDTRVRRAATTIPVHSGHNVLGIAVNPNNSQQLIAWTEQGAITYDIRKFLQQDTVLFGYTADNLNFDLSNPHLKPNIQQEHLSGKSFQLFDTEFQTKRQNPQNGFAPRKFQFSLAASSSTTTLLEIDGPRIKTWDSMKGVLMQYFQPPLRPLVNYAKTNSIPPKPNMDHQFADFCQHEKYPGVIFALTTDHTIQFLDLGFVPRIAFNPLSEEFVGINIKSVQLDNLENIYSLDRPKKPSILDIIKSRIPKNYGLDILHNVHIFSSHSYTDNQLVTSLFNQVGTISPQISSSLYSFFQKSLNSSSLAISSSDLDGPAASVASFLYAPELKKSERNIPGIIIHSQPIDSLNLYELQLFSIWKSIFHQLLTSFGVASFEYPQANLAAILPKIQGSPIDMYLDRTYKGFNFFRLAFGWNKIQPNMYHLSPVFLHYFCRKQYDRACFSIVANAPMYTESRAFLASIISFVNQQQCCQQLYVELSSAIMMLQNPISDVKTITFHMMTWMQQRPYPYVLALFLLSSLQDSNINFIKDGAFDRKNDDSYTNIYCLVIYWLLGVFDNQHKDLSQEKAVEGYIRDTESVPLSPVSSSVSAPPISSIDQLCKILKTTFSTPYEGSNIRDFKTRLISFSSIRFPSTMGCIDFLDIPPFIMAIFPYNLALELLDLFSRIGATLGYLPALSLTGLYNIRSGLLLQNYLDNTGDIQTVAFLSCFSQPLSQKPNNKYTRWVATYCNFLNSLELFQDRCLFDVSRSKLQSFFSNSYPLQAIAAFTLMCQGTTDPPKALLDHTFSLFGLGQKPILSQKKQIIPTHIPTMTINQVPSPLVYQNQHHLACIRCLKPISNFSLSSSINSHQATSQTPTNIYSCVHCAKSIPQCSVCRNALGTSILPTNAQLTSSLSDFGQTGSCLPPSAWLNNLGSVPNPTEYILCETLEKTLEKNPVTNKIQNHVTHWITWCASCGHGGHLDHLIEWFEVESTCPVVGCECTDCLVDTCWTFPE